MVNTIKTQDLIVAEGLAILSNELVFTNKINRAYEDKFNLEVQDHRTGSSIRIPKPPKFTVRSGWTRSAQDFIEDSVTLSIDTPKGIDCDFTDAELALLINNPDSMPEWSKRFLKPRITRLANEIDSDVFTKCMVLVPNSVGTPGTTPQTFGVLGDAMEKMDNNLAPRDGDRTTILNAKANNKMSDALKGLFVNQVSEKALLRGYIPVLADFELFMSQTVPNQTVGAQGGTPLVNGASQTGASLITDGWSNSITGVLKKGDIFTLAGVYMVNPVTKQVYPDLQQFVVTADANSNGSGQSTLGIYPSIITSGATQTVNASPADNAAITVLGTASTAYAQNMAFHKDAFTVAFAKMIVPQGTDKASQKTYDGFTMRYIRDFDTTNAKMIDRLDVYYGTCGLYPEWACRITG